MEAAKPHHVKKGKKKQVKDESDRIKQAEKKKRRLEKALATSAAIRSELEKKKQKKKEEQQRLDEEVAAIAEAVALQVLIGEDSDGSTKTAVKKDEELNPWHCPNNVDLFMNSSRLRSVHSHEDLTKSSFQSIGWIPSTFSWDSKWSYLEDSDSSLSSSSSFQWLGIEDVRYGHTDVSNNSHGCEHCFISSDWR